MLVVISLSSPLIFHHSSANALFDSDSDYNSTAIYAKRAGGGSEPGFGSEPGGAGFRR